MKVPLTWLTEFVPVDLPLEELVEVMGRNGLEVEEVRRPGADVSGVVVAQVVDVSDHPDADKLAVVTVDDGSGERTVLAGARNMRAGDLVPLALPGATLPTDDGVIEIGRRDMRGITSEGMLCSPRELQVADEHGGILVLEAGGARLEATAGTDIREVLPLGEPVIDISVPADRGDLHSVYGIARDLAAILDVRVADPTIERDEGAAGEGPVPIDIADPDGCSTYVGWAVTGMTVGPSPWWLRRRLEVCGIRSVSNLVDVTNYVMLELGQPLHAFDLDTLAGPEITVRWARPGELLVTLDGKERALERDDLVIADADRAVALAGVMGGEETEVGPATTQVLIEAATFDPAAIQRTSRRLGLVSEASMRFERRVDPEGAARAAARAVDLLVAHAGGTDAGVQVAGGDPPQAETVRLDPQWTGRFLGIGEIAADTQEALLRRAGIEVTEASADRIVARAPSWRGDLTRPADLVEEIARLHGYDRIPATLPSVASRGGRSSRQTAERDVRQVVRAAGLHEAETLSFVADDAFVLLAPDDGTRVRLQNPLAKDTGVMRPGLVEGLLAAARRNVGQGRPGLGLFEIGRIFRTEKSPLNDVPGAPGWQWSGPDGDPLPAQPMALGLMAYGPRLGPDWLDRDDLWDVYDLLGVADEVHRVLAPARGAEGRLERVPVERSGLHPGRTASLTIDGHEIGVVGQLHPEEARRRDLPESVVVGELLLDPLWAHLDGVSTALPQAPVIPRHPAVNLDVAVVAPDDVAYARVEAAVRDGAGALLEDLWWFDEYRGEQVGEGRRSLAFQLRLQASDRQLTDADADEVIEQIAAAVDAVGGALRR